MLKLIPFIHFGAKKECHECSPLCVDQFVGDDVRSGERGKRASQRVAGDLFTYWIAYLASVPIYKSSTDHSQTTFHYHYLPGPENGSRQAGQL